MHQLFFLLSIVGVSGILAALFAIFFPFLFLGSPQGLQFLDGFAHRLIRLAHANSTHKNMQSHL